MPDEPRRRAFAAIDGVKAMTDVTGFGLLGHLSEVCRGAGVQAQLRYADIPKLPGVEDYIAAGACRAAPGATLPATAIVMGEDADGVAGVCCAIRRLRRSAAGGDPGGGGGSSGAPRRSSALSWPPSASW